MFFNNVVAPGGGAIPTPTPPGTEFKASAHVAFVYEVGSDRNCLQIQVTNFDAGSATAVALSGLVADIRAENGGECPAGLTATFTPTRTATPTSTKTSIINPN